MAADFRFLATTVLLFGVSGTTDADILHQINFSQPARVMVWTGDDGPRVGQSIEVGPASIRTRMAPGVVQTGFLVPVTSSSYSTGDVRQSVFRVASNAPFAIRAQASSGRDVRDLSFELRLGEVGPNAALPRQSGPGPRVTLGDLEGGSIVYRSPQRTAAKPGEPSSQAIEFIAEWDDVDELDIGLTVFTYAPGPN